jgi:hypothetical protein
LPEPANWPSGRRLLQRVTWGVAALVAAGVFTGTHRLVVGDHVGAVVFFSFLVPIVVFLAAAHLAVRGHTSLRADGGSTGTTLRADRTFTTLVLATCGSFVPIGIYFVVVTINGDLDLAGFRHGRVGALLLAVPATSSAIGCLMGAWRRGGIGYVKLTPAGIEIADIRRYESVSWTDLVAVDDHSESKRRTLKPIVLRLRDGTEKTIDGAYLYVPNGAGLYWMVRHYWRHPEDRVELIDDRALERLRDGQFDLT